MNIETYKQKIRQLTGSSSSQEVEVFSFGNTSEMMDEIGQLVLNGIKTGTSSGLDLYTKDEIKPYIGQLAIVVDSQGLPLCGIRNTNVETIAFKDVTKEHAVKEGEGDKSLAYWRQAHVTFFSDSYRKELGREFDDDTRLIFEEFEVIDRYKKTLRGKCL